jgi:hypothetical protein
MDMDLESEPNEENDMATALQIKIAPTRATITLGPIDVQNGVVTDSLVVTGDDVHVSVDLLGDADMITLVDHMLCDGDVVEGHVLIDATGFHLVQIDGLTDLEPLFDCEQEPTGDPVIDAVMGMSIERTMDDDASGTFVLTGIPGIRLITSLVRGDDGECDFDRAREHVLLALDVPEDGMSVRTAARAIWAAKRAEYAETVSFYESTRASAENRVPMRYDEIAREAIRERTLLAGMGLVPSTTGRSYHVCDMEWVGCSVRAASDGWLEVSLQIDT